MNKDYLCSKITAYALHLTKLVKNNSFNSINYYYFSKNACLNSQTLVEIECIFKIDRSRMG